MNADLDLDLRYPIGRFTAPDEITADQRAQWIEAIDALPNELQEAVSGLSQLDLSTPYRPGGWTVRQVVHHVADSHINAYVRFKLALTEDQPTIKTYQEARWAELPDTEAVPVQTSLVLLEALHHRWVALMRGMSEADWTRGYRHPEQGRHVPLQQAAGLYAWHGRHHTAHITSLRARNGW